MRLLYQVIIFIGHLKHYAISAIKALNYYANQLNIASIWGQYQPLVDL